MNWSTPLLIQKKRDGLELTDNEIEEFVRRATSGEIPNYQVSAFLMAVYFQGLSSRETVRLTQAMRSSGKRLNFESVAGIRADKHSTGGVGDKTSFLIAPILASCGLKVPSMAGRGLGHSGGTLDKLEAIPGFRCELTESEIQTTLQQAGAAIFGQTQEIVPADKLFYGIRDVTATVDCIPLIVASILSKKSAENTQYLILDVKTGNGAFMQKTGSARKLAKMLVQVAKKLDLKCRAVISSMDQPLGATAGNSLEILECIALLKGRPSFDSETSSVDLKELTLHMCGHILEMTGISKNWKEGRKLAQEKLNNGEAWEYFKKTIAAQGGSVTAVENESLPLSRRRVTITARKKGFLNTIDTRGVGNQIVQWGGGRAKVTDPIDPGVGVVFFKKGGTKVNLGDPIAELYLPETYSESAVASAQTDFQNLLKIESQRKPQMPLLVEPNVI